MNIDVYSDEIVLEVSPLPAVEVEVSETVIEIETGGGSGGDAVWGSITGELSNQQDLAAALAGKSDTGHDHDGRYYTESETDSLLAGKSDTGHTHDDRYYTETETDNLLAGLVNDSGAGYCKMPDGTLIQWGSTSIERKVGINTAAVTFPIAYKAGNPPVVMATTQTSAYAPYLNVYPNTITGTSANIALSNTNTSAYNDGAVNWLAVGRWK